MFTDMVGYTALGQRNEALSLALVEEQRKLIRPILGRHGGREIKTMGDAFLVEFPNALDAVRCAYDVQRATREFNISLPSDRRIHLRVGLHLGDVTESQGDISGDAVNVASRIEPLAEDGGVFLTRQVYDHVQNKFELPLESLGTKSLKNVSEPLEVYRMVMPWDDRKATPTQLDKKRIAILPFANMSPDPNDGYFADGMTEELISTTSSVAGLTLIARTSVMGYKGTTKKVEDIGKELSVGTVLEGSVRKVGNKLRITVQLIDVQSQGHLWAQSYDRDFDDVFAVQSDVARQVAEALKVRMLPDEVSLLEKKPTRNTEAYTLFLQGRELLREGGESSVRQAVGLLTKAVELDPSFARAYVALAACYQHLGNSGYDPWEESIAAAKAPLRKALDLDPDLAEAHAVLSVLLFNEDDMVNAEAEARRAIELNPSLAEAYNALSNVVALRGEAEEAVRLVETYYRLDPITPSNVRDLGMVYFYVGREKEALQHWEKTAQLAPAGTYRVMAEYYLSKGDNEKAKELHAMAEKLEPAHPWVTWMKGFMTAQAGNRDSALQVIRKIEESRTGPLRFNDIAFVYYALGDLDSYFDYLNRAVDHHALNVGYALYCPLFERGRADPRYRAMLQKMRSMFWPEEQ
jgi:TolB-like protein/Tfp pilus assembly protein PilF